MQRFQFGEVTVEIGDGLTLTRIPDGSIVPATHSEQAGQAALARELGYSSVEDMNREHDMLHSLLAHLLGLPASPTLEGVASKQTYQYWREEEAAVFALCKFAHCTGVDLTVIAEQLSDRPVSARKA